MRVFLFANNRASVEVASILRVSRDRIVGLALHPAKRRKFGPQILAATRAMRPKVFQAERLRDSETLAKIRRLEADVGVSVSFGYILKRPLLDVFPRGVVNLHPGYLPWNRGAYPNVWSIIDGTPAGATLHVVDEGVDTGAILDQVRVEVSPSDTGESLYQRLEESSLDLFRQAWPRFKRGRITPRPQDIHAGTVHRVKDVEALDRIDPKVSYEAGKLFDILRARTFPPHPGAYLQLSDGTRIGIRVEVAALDQGPSRPRRGGSKRI